MSEPVGERRQGRRADAGSRRATERDLTLLRVVAEQYALTLPQLASLMGRTDHAARWLRARWQAAGWVQARPLLVGWPVFVWLTRRGLNVAGLDYSVWQPSPGRLAHVEAVTEVRIDTLARHPKATWVSERDLGFGSNRHRPDGLVRMDGREVAIEVELTLKERRRAQRIMRDLLAHHRAVTYFAAPAAHNQLSEIAQALGAGRVQVLALPDRNDP